MRCGPVSRVGRRSGGESLLLLIRLRLSVRTAEGQIPVLTFDPGLDIPGEGGRKEQPSGEVHQSTRRSERAILDGTVGSRLAAAGRNDRLEIGVGPGVPAIFQPLYTRQHRARVAANPGVSPGRDLRALNVQREGGACTLMCFESQLSSSRLRTREMWVPRER